MARVDLGGGNECVIEENTQDIFIIVSSRVALGVMQTDGYLVEDSATLRIPRDIDNRLRTESGLAEVRGVPSSPRAGTQDWMEEYWVRLEVLRTFPLASVKTSPVSLLAAKATGLPLFTSVEAKIRAAVCFGSIKPVALVLI
jgi:hypothetical protein